MVLSVPPSDDLLIFVVLALFAFGVLALFDDVAGIDDEDFVFFFFLLGVGVGVGGSG